MTPYDQALAEARATMRRAEDIGILLSLLSIVVGIVLMVVFL